MFFSLWETLFQFCFSGAVNFKINTKPWQHYVFFIFKLHTIGLLMKFKCGKTELSFRFIKNTKIFLSQWIRIFLLTLQIKRIFVQFKCVRKNILTPNDGYIVSFLMELFLLIYKLHISEFIILEVYQSLQWFTVVLCIQAKY